MVKKAMTIARLADKGGVGVETVRYYQRRGLLPVQPRMAGGRRYDEADARRLRFIRQAQAPGRVAGASACAASRRAKDERIMIGLLHPS